MNNTLDYGPDNQSIGSLGYSIGLSFGVVIVIIILTYFSCKCTQSRTATNRSTTTPSNSIRATTQDDSITIQRGLNEATILSYPKFLYSQAKLHHGGSTTSGCSICLADYKDADMLRLLPDCGHLFHLKCLDPWLRIHPTCPICRNWPAPNPQPTPLAEVVPQAT